MPYNFSSCKVQANIGRQKQENQQRLLDKNARKVCELWQSKHFFLHDFERRCNYGIDPQISQVCRVFDYLHLLGMLCHPLHFNIVALINHSKNFVCICCTPVFSVCNMCVCVHLSLLVVFLSYVRIQLHITLFSYWKSNFKDARSSKFGPRSDLHKCQLLSSRKQLQTVSKGDLIP